MPHYYFSSTIRVEARNVGEYQSQKAPANWQKLQIVSRPMVASFFDRQPDHQHTIIGNMLSR